MADVDQSAKLQGMLSQLAGSVMRWVLVGTLLTHCVRLCVQIIKPRSVVKTFRLAIHLMF